MLNIDAVIVTSHMMDIEREGRAEGRDARQFKKDLDEESYLQTSMLADAGDEGLQLTRFTEADECETEELAQEVQDFILKIKLLMRKANAAICQATPNLRCIISRSHASCIWRMATQKALVGHCTPQKLSGVGACRECKLGPSSP